MNTLLLDSQQSLLQWVSQATGINTVGVKVRLRGNDLHILCEGLECPQRWRTLSDLLHAIQQTDLDVLTSREQPSIYQVFVYGRKKGEYRPQWCHKVHLNQLERHLEQVEQALLANGEKTPGGALILSNESLARRGDVNAIARYLSETLSAMGVGVQVSVKQHQPSDGSPNTFNRLWIFCQSAYSPDPSLIAEPVAQKLRQLKLDGYRDAVIAAQIMGETNPDWLLRIDLTPVEVMLKEWARWGDVQAIARILTAALSDTQVAVQVSLQESTLHIFCQSAANALADSPVPEKTICVETILSHLEAIAPQGILAATVYGQKSNEQQPEWIDWLKLPASEHPALATSTLDLAITGDEPAIVFLLERLLNTDLDRRLKTGGVRVLWLRKDDLLHIMCDAPICPSRKQVAPKVIQFLRQLNLAGTAGVRVYGRRAGNKEPFWHYGVDLVHRQRLVPEATPEFAATSEYIQDLITKEDDEPILRPDITGEEVQNFISDVARDWVTTATATVKKALLNTQIFTESGESVNQIPDTQGIKVALVWSTLGLLITLQTDWILGQIVTRTMPNAPHVSSITQPSPPEPESSLSVRDNQTERTAFFASNSQPKGGAFNATGFTQEADQPKSITSTPIREKATASAILLAARSQMPSFNVRQLDEQLVLYRQRIAKNGKPADVLIIGSSRALRGIDPMALSKALALQGYPKVDVFNFGINGATAQVVDFVIRQVLQPSELPKIIVWADGSRAFNNGREDLTFKAIASSQGYQNIVQKIPTTANSEQPAKNSENTVKIVKKAPKTEKNNYQVIDHWLNQGISALSASYQHRDQVKTLLQNKLESLPIFTEPQTPAPPISSTIENADENTNLQAVDFDGFLALSVRFNPARYYQKHSKVTGNYDNDYKSFQVGGEQDAALQNVLQFAQSQNISLVFVNMPLTSEYLDPVRKKYEQEFQQYMLGLASNPNFIYRDLSQLWPQANDYFSDPSHLNRFGAYEVSKKLASDPMISWTAK